jgi:hypothetical protein
MPTHNHEQNGRNVSGAEAGDGHRNWVFGDNTLYTGLPGDNDGSFNASGYDTFDEGSGAAHEHGDTGDGDLTFVPLYIDTILASKD